MKKLLPLLVLAALLSPARAEWIPAMAPNGSFERDANRDGKPDEWATATFKSLSRAEWDRQVAHSGKASVRVTDSKHPTNAAWDANTGRWILSRSHDCAPGETVTLRGWVRTELTAGTATLVLSWSGGGKWLHEDGSKPVTGKSDWTEREVTAEAPEHADSVRAYLILNSGAGSAWFDDVEMVRGTAFPGDYRPVDLRAACSVGFADEKAGDGKGGWTDQGPNDARELPAGRQTFRNVPFEIIDPAGNGGRSCVALRGGARKDLPASAEIPVGQRCDVLYFLHAAAWVKKGQPAARYRIEMEDGSTVVIPVRAGQEVSDWWSPADTKESAAGWQGKNAEKEGIGLTLFPWRNPKPEVAVRGIRFETADTGALPILVAVTAADGPPVLEERPVDLEFTDTSGWYPWAFGLEDPTLKELDLSHLLDAPAGKHGFLAVGPDGHFRFRNGTRIRFFGTNLVGAACAPEKATADALSERFARHGINMIRLHAFDSQWAGLIDYARGDSRAFGSEALDRMDYLVAQLIQRGIYVYVDLLDYRSFQPGDGVRAAEEMGVMWERSIKAASNFDPRMIELQKEYATQLLTHRNPYTGRRWADEPGIALVEITNENSLFYLRSEKLMLPSYVADLSRRWQEWLAKRHGNREGLAKAWSNAAGECALLEDEDRARGTVLFPLRLLYADLREAPYRGERSPARLNAMTRFLYEMQVAYLDEMTRHLRGLGVKCPITGTNQDFSDASNRANTRCDVTTRNNYWCHPNVQAKPMRFRNAAMVRSEIVSEENPVANVCSSTAVGKPMIAPEFNFPWPNEWRAECLPLMAAYGRLQDWDGLLYFTYGRSSEETLNSFNIATDPVRWGQVPLAALLFLRGDLDTARNTVHVGNSEVDCFATRPQRTDDRYSPYRVLPYLSKVRNAYFDAVYEGDADVVISSGHSSAGDYSKARRAIVFADWPYADLAASKPDRGASARATMPGLRTRLLDTPITTEQGRFDTVLDTGAPGTTSLLNDRLCLFPHAGGQSDPAWLHRLYLRAARQWGLPSAAPDSEAGRIFRSDTGQLVLDREKGLFTAAAPRVRVATGFFSGTASLGDVTVECRTPFASVSLVSLDGEPVETSRRMLLTAVARSENTGQATTDKHGAIPERGRTPVLAEPVDCRVTIRTKQPLHAWPLNARAEKGDAARVKLVSATGVLQVETAGAKSPWVLLAAE